MTSGSDRADMDNANVDDAGGQSCCSQDARAGRAASASGGSCCCGSSEEQRGGSGGARCFLRPRSIIFVVVVAAAIAVAVWSLVKANKDAADTGSRVRQENVAARQSARAADPGLTPALRDLAPGKDFAFVLLAGADAAEAAAVARTVQQASTTLGKREIEAAVVTLQRHDGDFKKLVSALNIDKLPAVVLLGSTGAPTVVAGEITEDTLLRNYVQAACGSVCTGGACGIDASAPGCCPGQ